MTIFRRSDAENYIGELDEFYAVDMLQRRFSATDRAGFQERRQALRNLFATLSPQVATYFYGKLRQKRRQDQLSRLFYGRLAGATRRELLCILQRRMSNHAITPQSCRNSASQTEFETQLAAAATEVEREMENAAEWMSQDQRRPSWWRTAGAITRRMGGEIIKQQVLPDGLPDDVVDGLIEQARQLYDLRHVGLLPLRMTIYTLLGRGLPPLQALRSAAQQLRLPPRQTGPGSRGRITQEQVRAMERRMQQRGFRPGGDPRLRRQREAEFEHTTEAMVRRAPTPEEIAARRRGTVLVRQWIQELDKSNLSGTPVRPRAQIRAGNQLIQEANRMPNSDPRQEAFRRHGNYLMDKGRQGLHKSQRGGRRAMREFETELEQATHALQHSLEYESPSLARPTLRRGSTGEAVRDLQTRLRQAGYNPGPIDGIFGSGTDAAVRSFQAAQALVVDGIVGPQTWDALIRAGAGKPGYSTSPSGPAPGSIAGRILNEARNHIGFHEGPNNENPFSAYFGVPNVAWCAYFVSYVYTKAGFPLNIGSCDTMLHYLQSKGRFIPNTTPPRPGNIVIFDWTQGDHDPAEHVGIVEKVYRSSTGQTRVGTIEGNSGEGVNRRDYALGDVRIVGFGQLV